MLLRIVVIFANFANSLLILYKLHLLSYIPLLYQCRNIYIYIYIYIYTNALLHSEVSVLDGEVI